MEKVYLVWREESEREDAKRVKANYSEQAVRTWAEWADSWSADYTIVGGQEERVFVALDADGSEPEMFEVRGESMPVYFARSVSPNVEFSGTPAASSPEAPLERRVGGAVPPAPTFGGSET